LDGAGGRNDVLLAALPDMTIVRHITSNDVRADARAPISPSEEHRGRRSRRVSLKLLPLFSGRKDGQVRDSDRIVGWP
jgi:hypothetical protein